MQFESSRVHKKRVEKKSPAKRFPVASGSTRNEPGRAPKNILCLPVSVSHDTLPLHIQRCNPKPATIAEKAEWRHGKVSPSEILS